jgi:osmoprotectant transport system ATP-binding protein
MIRFDSVTKKYGNSVAVEGLDLIAPSGEITVLVGPSGCGKTTSLRMINRMISPSSGRIWIDDRDTSKGSAAKLRRGIGYVIQHAGLFPHRTIVDNIATVPYLLGTRRREGRLKALELMERVGLDASFAERYPAQLSGGQQQRVGVARALAADPPVMLMDEPFSAVDPVVREQLQNEFLRLQSDLGKTIVFVTHDIDEAIKLGDHVAVLRVGGRLAQLATPSELLARPADPFVAAFVGRDRGYRALGFTQVDNLYIDEEPAVRLGMDVGAAHRFARDGWVLVVDNENAPQGWLDVLSLDERTTGEITPSMLNLGGTLATARGTLREVLDTALSSPSGRGVIIDDDGSLRGSVTAAQVLARIEALNRRTSERPESDQPAEFQQSEFEQSAPSEPIAVNPSGPAADRGEQVAPEIAQ